MRKDSEPVDELREEYDFSHGVRGKYAARYSEGTNLIEGNLISIEPETAHWRSRSVRYYKGSWPEIQSRLPMFDLKPFTAGSDGDPANPFLQVVMRRPIPSKGRPIPVGVVGDSYTLVPHLEVAKLCHEAVVNMGCSSHELRHEVGLSEMGEWMNLSIYFPSRYGFRDSHNEVIDLRLECFNSVDGSCRLVILFGWFRLVCSNGLVIGDTKIVMRERHGRHLDLGATTRRIDDALRSVETDRRRIKKWEQQRVRIDDVAAWSDEQVSKRWGKKAAARVFHICDSGRDVELAAPFEPGSATEKRVRFLERVPGSPERATTKYDVSQALSFVATRRSNTAERVAWQGAIPSLINSLQA